MPLACFLNALSSHAWSIKNGVSQMGYTVFGTPEGTRTPDLLIRSQSLYPTELLAHTFAQRLDIIAQRPGIVKRFLIIFGNS